MDSGGRLISDVEGMLQRQIAHCLRSSYYQRKFEEHGIDPSKIRSLDDLRQLPILATPDQHRHAQEESREREGHPFGTLLAARPDEIVFVASTSGTTGEPTFYPFTQRDMDITDELWIRAFRFIGIRPGDIVLQAFGLSMYLAGIPVVRALQKMGAAPIPVGAEAGTEKLLRMARIVKPRVLCCTPSYAEYLIEKVPEVLGGLSARDLGVEVIMCAGEPGAGLPEVRAKLEDGWGARIHDVLGGAHGIIMASAATSDYHGMYVLANDYSVSTDLVDPETKEPIDMVDGAIGERVKTALEWGGSPPLRYSVGDVYQVFTERIPGLPALPRIKVIGRVDDLLIVKGVKVYPAAVVDLVNGFVPETTGEVRIVLSGPPPKVEPPLRLRIEHREGLDEAGQQQLAERITATMHDRLTVRPTVELVAPGSLSRSTHKKKLIEIETA
jgi:phenylacetate-CoA ligase